MDPEQRYRALGLLSHQNNGHLFSSNFGSPGSTSVNMYGDAPMTDMFGINLNGSDMVYHDNSGLQGPGSAIGAAIGSIWGMPQLGSMAGRNAGSTVGDLMSGNIDGLGADISQNFPPGFQDKGWKGIMNGATGLPLSKILSLFD